MKSRGLINLAVDALMFLCFAFLAGIGFMLEYVLPPGRERFVLYGENIELLLFGLDRRDWGTVHLWVAFILIGLLGAHIILHWSLIKALLKRAVRPVGARRAVVAGFIVAIFFLVFFPFLVEPEKGERAGGRGRREALTAEADSRVRHEPGSFTGRMTLAEAAGQLGISTAEAKRRLGLPAETPDGETLGHLRRELNLSMTGLTSRMRAE